MTQDSQFQQEKVSLFIHALMLYRENGGFVVGNLNIWICELINRLKGYGLGMML